MTEESVDCFPRVEMFRVRGLAGNVGSRSDPEKPFQNIWSIDANI